MDGKRLDAWCALMAGRLALEEFGWEKGDLENSDGNVCAVGALRKAQGIDPDADLFGNQIVGLTELDELGLPTRWSGCGAVGDWNDAEERQYHHVLAAFDRALRALERGD